MKPASHESSDHFFIAAYLTETACDEQDDAVAPSLDLTASTLNQALRDVAHEELEVVRSRYHQHGDPVRCAVGISLSLRSLAEDIYGESRIARFRGVGWLNFLLRTSDETVLRPDFIETMSPALYGDPVDVEFPNDCGFWFDVAASWIDHQRNQPPAVACVTALEADV
ncbi:MAG TPA: hypothetical protein EYG46_03585 [Myxococcales bacterium]|nr:hypothetical protein [Myxococcales bacterium]HIM00062.1 hypothetical protein [Myxococcales bacterium]